MTEVKKLYVQALEAKIAPAPVVVGGIGDSVGGGNTNGSANPHPNANAFEHANENARFLRNQPCDPNDLSCDPKGNTGNGSDPYADSL